MPVKAVVVRDTDVTTQRGVIGRLGGVPFARRGRIAKVSSRYLVSWTLIDKRRNDLGLFLKHRA